MNWIKLPGKRKEAAESESNRLFQRLKEDIRPIRPQGAPPDRNPGSFAQVCCDLCNGTAPVSEVRQCTVCGRWACPSCRDETYYLCRSCSGTLNLYLLEMKMTEQQAKFHPDSKENQLPPNNG